MEYKPKKNCYYAEKYVDEVAFTYCTDCRRAFELSDENYFIPIITKDLNDNKQCISFVRKDERE